MAERRRTVYGEPWVCPRCGRENVRRSFCSNCRLQRPAEPTVPGAAPRPRPVPPAAGAAPPAAVPAAEPTSPRPRAPRSPRRVAGLAFVTLGLLLAAGVVAVLVAGRVGRGDDRHLAERVALRASDLPGAGWRLVTSSSRAASGDGFVPEATAKELERCLGREDPSVRRGTAQAISQFAHDQGRFVASQVNVLRTVADATAAVDLVAGEPFPHCLSGVLAPQLERSLAPGQRLEVVGVAPLDVPRLGDRSLGYRLVAALRTATTSGNVVFDYAFVRRGRVLAQVAFTSPGQPMSAAEEKAVLAGVVARMG